MPAKPNVKPSSLGGRLGAKAGPLPVWAWAAIILVGGYIIYKRRQGSGGGTLATTASSGGQPQTGSGSDTAGAVGGTTDPNSALTDAFASLLAQNQAALENLQGGGMSGSGFSSTGAGGGGGGGGFDAFGNPIPAGHHDTFNYEWLLQQWGYGPSEIWSIEDRRKKGLGGFPTGPGSTGSLQPKTTPGVPKPPARTPPFGGIVNVRTLANGSKLTSYASGRKVEQVPGKTPYVVKA